MKQELELYLHIPFCVRKCAYCDFLSATADENTRDEYVHTVIKEIEGYKEKYRDEYEVTTIFVGGGTPSILDGEQILSIFDALYKNFQIAENAEITIEVNPGTVTVKKLKAWNQSGINRLSIGLQSVNDDELKLLGRIHNFREFCETYSMAREAGFCNINIDLISAIPGQTIESWKNTLVKVAGMNPEHISAYSLIIEEGTPFYERYGGLAHKMDEDNPGQGKFLFPSLPDEDTERTIYEITEGLLGQYGYHRYEISNYSKMGFECRHNKGYWERTEYLGIGLGASSLIHHARFHNTSDYKDYINNIQKGLTIKEEVEQLSLAEEIEEYMFLGLREMKGISLAKFREIFGYELLSIYRSQIEKLEQAGLLQVEQDSVFLTKRGIDLSNTVFVEFLEPNMLLCTAERSERNTNI